jgi:hypothetical protein
MSINVLKRRLPRFLGSSLAARACWSLVAQWVASALLACAALHAGGRVTLLCCLLACLECCYFFTSCAASEYLQFSLSSRVVHIQFPQIGARFGAFWLHLRITHTQTLKIQSNYIKCLMSSPLGWQPVSGLAFAISGHQTYSIHRWTAKILMYDFLETLLMMQPAPVLVCSCQAS